MEEIEKLKSIGAREISQHTHIALNRVQYILECEYKQLKDSATTQGLLQILRREYQVDLKQWEEEYKEFWRSYDGKDEEIGPLVNFKVTHETIAQNDSKKGVLLGALLVVFLGVGFFSYMDFDSNSATLKDSSGETQQPLAQEDEQTDTIEQNLDTFEATNNFEISAPSPLNILPQESKEQEKLEQPSVSPHKISIVPLRNVWIGIVYLDSRRRSSFIAENAFEVDLTRPQTIVTGHGMLELDVSGEKSAFNAANKMFFIVDENGNFTQVTQGQYEVATRDLGW